MLWDCVPRVCGGEGGCAGGGVPLGAVPALSWCGEVSLGRKHVIIGQTRTKLKVIFGARLYLYYDLYMYKDMYMYMYMYMYIYISG